MPARNNGGFMLEDKIYKDYVSALKAKDKAISGFLSYIRAELKNAAINSKKDKIDDNEVISILKKQKKRLEESIEAMINNAKPEVLDGLKAEIALLDQYLPKPLESEELDQLILSVIAQTQAVSMKDMGRVMKEVSLRAGARADAKMVSQIVKTKLSAG